MPGAKILRIYLDPGALKHARDGQFNFINRIRNALEPRGFRVELRRNSDTERLKSAARGGYSLFLMDDPFHPNALTMRRSYFYPFWRIEASAKRWEFDVAQKSFDPTLIDAARAEAWANKWRKWLFGDIAGQVSYDGPIYVPLQGRLLHHRSFQSASPIEMLAQVADNFPARQVVAGLHPDEVYTSAERKELEKLSDNRSNLNVTTGRMAELLATCSFVVTQNSSAALFGYFFHKPAVLFGRIDFHHIACNTHQIGANSAFEQVQHLTPEYDKYLYWFTMLNAISAHAEDCEDQILSNLRNHDWQVD